MSRVHIRSILLGVSTPPSTPLPPPVAVLVPLLVVNHLLTEHNIPRFVQDEVLVVLSDLTGAGGTGCAGSVRVTAHLNGWERCG